MTQIRLSPSGPVIGNAQDAPLDFGPGARLRLAEALSTIGGTTTIPGTASQDTAVLSALGFPNPDPFAPITVTLDNPKEGYQYRAKITLDVANVDASIIGEIVIALDTSIDGGTTWEEQTKTGHYVSVDTEEDSTGGARTIIGWLPLTLGSALGLDDDTPAPSIQVRARVFNDALGVCRVNSPATFSGVSGLQGSIHFELEECF